MVVLAPSPDAIKEIHNTFVRRYGVAGYMCEGMVEGCLERATTYVYKFQPFPKLFLKAAALLYSIIIFHPFVDANKRTAFESTKILLRLNGYQLTVTSAEGVNFTKSIAESKIRGCRHCQVAKTAFQKRCVVHTSKLPLEVHYSQLF